MSPAKSQAVPFASSWQAPADSRGRVPTTLLLLPSVQSCDSERVWIPTYFGQAGTLHSRQHFLRRRKSLDRRGQIRVGAADSRNQRSDARQHLLEVDAVKRAHRAFGLAEVEDTAFASGTQHTNDLA